MSAEGKHLPDIEKGEEQTPPNSKPNGGGTVPSTSPKIEKPTVPPNDFLDGGQDKGTIPGLDAFGSINNIAPFTLLWMKIAHNIYPDLPSRDDKAQKFVKDHKWVVRIFSFLDLLVRIALVLIIFIVILRGLSLWPEQILQSFGELIIRWIQNINP